MKYPKSDYLYLSETNVISYFRENFLLSMLILLHGVLSVNFVKNLTM